MAIDRERVKTLASSEARQWIWYIGIDLNAFTSIPRSSRIACTHFGVRPMPLQLSSGF